MTVLAKETEAANQRTREATAAAQQEEEKAENFEDEVLKAQKMVAKLEEELDQTMTAMRIAQESAEESDKQIVDWELQITALSRRLTLLNEEKDRNEERTKMNTVKMTEFERMYEEHEQGRKTAEGQCQTLDEQLELNEVALIEARQVAEDSNHKYEESVRKVKIVSHQLGCIIERAEDFEHGARETETKVKELQEQVKEIEVVNLAKQEKEDTLEAKIHELSERYHLSDSRAEFSERSVDKLETTIDNLLNELYAQKMSYKSISEKLDSTLNEMMKLHE